MRTNGQMDRHMTKLIFTFRNFENAPNIEWRKTARKDNGKGDKKIRITLFTRRNRKEVKFGGGGI